MSIMQRCVKVISTSVGRLANQKTPLSNHGNNDGKWDVGGRL